ncbi:MAG: hypothetical protein V3S03_03280 [Vicinamibacteria bacterium]
MPQPTEDAAHPVLVLLESAAGETRTLAQVAELVGIPYRTLVHMSNGLSGCSWKRAQEIAEQSEGRVDAAEVLTWHETHQTRTTGRSGVKPAEAPS